MAFGDRQSLWDRLQTGTAAEWDLIIVGGGITGAGVLREAVRRGYRALLIEQQDFAWGSSSRSSKMVHGGLRYLAAGNFELTRHALQERERLVREAPRLVHRLDYYFPLYKWRFPPRFGARLLFWLYDRLAGIDDHRLISNAELAARFPGLKMDWLNGAFFYTDAVTDDARLTLRVLHEAAGCGGQVLNYARGRQMIREGGRICGIRVQDAESHNEADLRAGVVINATGAWADRLRDPPPKGIRIQPQRGSHLVLDAQTFPVPAAIFMRHPEDGRRVFIYPWQNRTIVGTTDLLHDQDMNKAARMTQAELVYLLTVARRLFAEHPPTATDVLASWSGVRPILVSGKSRDASKASREHRVWAEPGLVGCSGGKLTTFHHMAMDVMDRAAPWLPACKESKNQQIFAPTSVQAAKLLPNDPDYAKVLIGRFGDDAGSLTAAAAPRELEPLLDTGFSLAELRWSLMNESVVHLDDLMLRRSRLGILLRHGGREVLDLIRPLCREVLGWDEVRWAREARRYDETIERYYSMPEPDSA
jgi:glycerol-3-phosphate dehydrogenase